MNSRNKTYNSNTYDEEPAMMKPRNQDLRLSPRRRLKIKTTLVHNQIPILNCATHDIGLNGAYIEIPYAVSIARIGDPVRLIVDIAGRNALILHGRISRHGENGAGVSFHRVSHRSNSVLLDLMFAHPHQSTTATLSPAQQQDTVGWR